MTSPSGVSVPVTPGIRIKAFGLVVQLKLLFKMSRVHVLVLTADLLEHFERQREQRKNTGMRYRKGFKGQNIGPELNPPEPDVHELT